MVGEGGTRGGETGNRFDLVNDVVGYAEVNWIVDCLYLDAMLFSLFDRNVSIYSMHSLLFLIIRTLSTKSILFL